MSTIVRKQHRQSEVIYELSISQIVHPSLLPIWITHDQVTVAHIYSSSLTYLAYRTRSF